jgi:hypothetical protein
MGKAKKPRQTGYYWVQWSYSGDEGNVVERVGFYNSRLMTWTIDGDSRRYHDIDFLAIDETHIRRYGAAFKMRLLRSLTVASIGYLLAMIAIELYKLITNITK